MAELAKNLRPLEPITADSSETPAKKPWQRMEGEPTFWFNRYKRFQSLGPKRTIRAAVEQERSEIKALNSTKTPATVDTPRAKVDNSKRNATPHGLAEVPKPKVLQVPGSWKQASIRWDWVSRAQAHDENKLDRMVEAMFDDLYEGPALAFYRVLMLRNLFTAITTDFNTSNSYMTFEQKIAYYARMTAMLRDIHDEMKTFDEPTQRLMMRHSAYKQYRDYKPDTSKQPDTSDQAQLLGKLAEIEAALKAREGEARRARK